MTPASDEPAQGGSWPVSGFFMGIMFSAAVLAFMYWRYRSWLDAHFRRCVSDSLLLCRQQLNQPKVA